MEGAGTSTTATRSKGDRWRQKSKHLKKLSLRSSMDTPPPEQGTEAGAEEGGEGAENKPASLQVPTQVQVIDVESHVEGIRPYSIYVLMTTRKRGKL